MKTVKLKNSDSNFISYTIRHYARTWVNLSDDDRANMEKLANKFRVQQYGRVNEEIQVVGEIDDDDSGVG